MTGYSKPGSRIGDTFDPNRLGDPNCCRINRVCQSVTNGDNALVFAIEIPGFPAVYIDGCICNLAFGRHPSLKGCKINERFKCGSWLAGSLSCTIERAFAVSSATDQGSDCAIAIYSNQGALLSTALLSEPCDTRRDMSLSATL